MFAWKRNIKEILNDKRCKKNTVENSFKKIKNFNTSKNFM